MQRTDLTDLTGEHAGIDDNRTAGAGQRHGLAGRLDDVLRRPHGPEASKTLCARHGGQIDIGIFPDLIVDKPLKHKGE